MQFADTSMMYHLVRGQGVIKLYIFYNMVDYFEFYIFFIFFSLRSQTNYSAVLVRLNFNKLKKIF